jgi:hypothetical protein
LKRVVKERRNFKNSKNIFVKAGRREEQSERIIIKK